MGAGCRRADVVEEVSQSKAKPILQGAQDIKAQAPHIVLWNLLGTSIPKLKGLSEGISGLENLGNTSFASALLQCLCNCQPFCDYFLAGCWKQDQRNLVSEVQPFANFLNELFEAQWRGNYRYMKPTQFIELVSAVVKEPADSEPDVLSVFKFLLESLHRELKRSVRNYNVEFYSDDLNVLEIAGVWKAHLLKNESLVTDLFTGLMRYSYSCTRCGSASSEIKPFNHLLLPILPGRNFRLEDLMRALTRPTTRNDSKCSRCNAVQTRTLSLCQLPPVLVLTLQRLVKTAAGFWKKVETPVSYPSFNFNVEPWLEAPSQNPPFYHLLALVEILGTSNKFHYTARCSNRDSQVWVSFNDIKVKRVESEEALTQDAYLLFYVMSRPENFHQQAVHLPELWPVPVSRELNEATVESSNLPIQPLPERKPRVFSPREDSSQPLQKPVTRSRRPPSSSELMSMVLPPSLVFGS